jgi:hypothetical protein
MTLRAVGDMALCDCSAAPLMIYVVLVWTPASSVLVISIIKILEMIESLMVGNERMTVRKVRI